MNDKEEWKRGRALEREGIDVNQAINPIHNSDESPKHLTLKMMTALKLARKGRPYSIEAPVTDGVIDVIDWGEDDGAATAYEIETAYTPEKARRKVEQYAGGMIRDVIVIPVQEAPDDPEEMLGWLDQHVA